MKYRDPETGEFKELYVKAVDTLPVGTEVDYEGEDVPAGWEEVESINDMKSNEIFFTGKYLNGKPVYGYILETMPVLTAGETKNIDLPFAKVVDIDKVWIDQSMTFFDNHTASANYNTWALNSGAASFHFKLGIITNSRLQILPDDSWGDTWTFTIMFNFTVKD